LLAQEKDDQPQRVVGTANLAEFLITLSSAMTFFMIIGISHWRIVLGLILGGAIAAPLAVFTIKYVPAKILISFAGVLVILVSIRMVVSLFL
jgi:hypothetical protein